MSNATTIKTTLEAMPIGTTGVRFGAVVTRWGADSYEIETWGRADARVSGSVAADRLSAK